MKKYQMFRRKDCSTNTFSRCQSNSGSASFPSFWNCWDIWKTHHFGNWKANPTNKLEQNHEDLRLNPCQCMTLIWCRCQIKHMASPPAVGWRGWEIPVNLLDNSLPSIPTAAAPCASPSPGSHWHTGGAGGWHIDAPSVVPCLTAEQTRTGIPGTWHRHPEQLNAGGRKVTPWGSQQPRASHDAHSSPMKENYCCPVLQSNLFVFQLLSFITTQTVGNRKAFSEVETPLYSLKNLHIGPQRLNSRSTLVFYIHIKIM